MGAFLPSTCFPYGTQTVGGLLEAFLADVMSDRGASCVCIWVSMEACCDSETRFRKKVYRLSSKWALITEWGISAGNKLCHLVDNTWRAGISDKDLICQAAMKVFMMAIEIDSPHKSSLLMCVCVLSCS